MIHPVSVEWHNENCKDPVMHRHPQEIFSVCATCGKQVQLSLEEQIREATESWQSGKPAHYSFSRRYYEGGQRYSEWFGLGYTGKKYYSSYYQNCGSMLQEISKEEFEKYMAVNLENKRKPEPWDAVRVQEPNWQMMRD